MTIDECSSLCEIPGVPVSESEWKIRIEPTRRWIRVKFAGETIADSKRVLVVTESGRLPVYYFPLSDVRTDLFEKTEQHTTCIHKGEASYWNIKVKDQVSENAVWGYLDPKLGSELIKGYVSFYWKKVDAWYEEEEEIFVHARDPYTRVDAISSSRHIQVVLDGQIVADSRRPVIVFETGLTPRYYLPKEDVRTNLLEPSDKTTRCPYKGIASYWSVNIGGKVYKDVVWSYVHPLPEIPKITGLLSFYNEEVDAVYVDGEKWSLRKEDRLPYKNV